MALIEVYTSLYMNVGVSVGVCVCVYVRVKERDVGMCSRTDDAKCGVDFPV